MRRLACLATLCAVALVLALPAMGLAGASFSKGSDWGSGFGGNVAVVNDQAGDVSDWLVELVTDREITSIWNAKIENRDGNRYLIRAESWNGALAPGKSASFGFNAQPGNVQDGDVAASVSFTAAPGSEPQPADPGQGDTGGDSGGSSGSGGTVQGQATFRVTGDWGSGFGGSMEVQNTGGATLEDWRLEFDFGHDITSIWNAKVLSHVGDHYVIGPASWNANIAPGGAVSFGFNGAPGKVSANPAGYVLTASNVQGDTGGSGDTGDSGGSSGGDSGGDTGGDTGGDAGSGTGDSGDTGIGGGSTGDTPAEGGPEHGKRVVAYFAQWGIYARDYQVSDIPVDKITHINYSFMGIDPATLAIRTVDEWADFQRTFGAENGLPAQTWAESEEGLAGNFGRLRQLKELHPHLKIMLCIGGWTMSTFFSDAALTAESRERFADSAVSLMAEHGFDGIDLDWEYPVGGGLPQCSQSDITQIGLWAERSCQIYRPEDKTNYTKLLKAIRERLDEESLSTGKNYELSIAGPVGYDKIVNMDLGNMVQYLDFINLMAYDMHGGWESSTNHHSPLYANPYDPSDPVLRERYNTDYGVDAYLAAGVPAEKIVIGLPFYGRAWEEVNDADNGLFQSAGSTPAPSGPGHWEAGFFDYWKLVELEAGAYTRHFDDHAKVPYLFGPNLTGSKGYGGMFVTYDDPESIAIKMDYVKSKGLGGAMFWELSGDVRDSTDSRSLLGTIDRELSR